MISNVPFTSTLAQQRRRHPFCQSRHPAPPSQLASQPASLELNLSYRVLRNACGFAKMWLPLFAFFFFFSVLLDSAYAWVRGTFFFSFFFFFFAWCPYWGMRRCLSREPRLLCLFRVEVASVRSPLRVGWGCRCKTVLCLCSVQYIAWFMRHACHA